MIKPYLRSIVRNGGKGRMGLGVELFRLDITGHDELTAEEQEAVDESDSKVSADGTAIMRIYEDIGEDFWTGGGVTAKRFADELDSFGEIKQLNIHINCLGGDVFTAQAIHSIIAEHDSNKTAYIDGVAASAATIIACGADEVIARHNSNYMIHHPWALAVGNAETMRKAADDLEQVTVPIISVYKAQVNKKINEKKIRELMDDETWMTADEALEYGFVNKVRGKIKAIAKVNKSQILCSGRLMDIAKYHYHNIPDYPLIKAKAIAEKPKFAKVPSFENEFQDEPKPKEPKHMTRDEIDPQLLGEIQVEARTAERARLSALDAMGGPGLSEIIAKAKADGKEPKDIAMECNAVMREQIAAANATNALARDAKAANAVPAGDAPLRKPETAKDSGGNLMANAFKAQRPKAMVNTNGN